MFNNGQFQRKNNFETCLKPNYPATCLLTFESALLKAGSSSSTSKQISVVVMDIIPRATRRGATSWAGLLRTTGPAEGQPRAQSVTIKKYIYLYETKPDWGSFCKTDQRDHRVPAACLHQAYRYVPVCAYKHLGFK